MFNDTLFANASLDRDALGPAPGGPGPRVAVQVQCFVWEEITGDQYTPIDTLRIDVLDQDDNPPMAQGNDSVDVILGEFTAVSERLSCCGNITTSNLPQDLFLFVPRHYRQLKKKLIKLHVRDIETKRTKFVRKTL